MLSATLAPVFAAQTTFGGDVAHAAPEPVRVDAENPFGRLVSLYRNNSLLCNELASVRLKIARASDYLASPACNPTLGAAHLLRLRARRSATLALLRANRIEARELLARAGDAPAPPSPVRPDLERN